MKITHYIKNNETLTSIAEKYGISIKLLLKENALLDNNIKGLKYISIPEIENDFEVIKNLDKELVYVVKENDPYIIENKSMVQAFGVKNPIIGDKIIISFNNTVHYIVKPLDTIYTISEKYSMAMEMIMKQNNLKSNKLYVGQILKI